MFIPLIAMLVVVFGGIVYVVLAAGRKTKDESNI